MPFKIYVVFILLIYLFEKKIEDDTTDHSIHL